jgi:serine/threonine-protein kinase SRPK3
MRTSKKIIVESSSESYESEEFAIESYESNSNEEEELDTDEIIYPGLILNNEYVLVKKIGYGNNAGVWMTYKISTQSYYAIKIQDYQCYDDGCREVNILKKIGSYIEKNQDINTYCVNMLDYFKYTEEKDNTVMFVCSVYDLYAGSIHTLISTGVHKYGLPIPVVKRITKQLLMAVSILHEDLHVIHTDIKPANILLKGTPLIHTKIINIFKKSMFQQKYDALLKKNFTNPKQLKEKRNMLALACVAKLDEIDDPFVCRPSTISDEESESGSIIEGEEDTFGDDDEESSESSDAEASRALNKRSQSCPDLLELIDYKEIHSLDECYNHMQVLNNKKDSTDHVSLIDEKYVNGCEIAVTDFGNSYFFEKRTKNEIQDRLYRAPEVILDFNYGYSCDLWSVGCVIFELLTGFPLFAPIDDPLTRDIHHLYLMEHLLGPLPLAMKKKSKRSKFLFDHENNYHIKNVDKFETSSLYDKFVTQFLFSKADAKKCSEFILTMLKYNPSSRETSKNLLNHAWLKDINL